MREDESRYPLSQKVVGMILSLPNKLIDRMLHGRTVYAARNSEESTQLRAGDRVFFYDTDGTGLLTAEAKIAKLAFKTRDQVLEYGRSLFISQGEFGEYLASARGGTEDVLLVLELEDVTEYSKPVKCPFEVTPPSMYLTDQLTGEILRANR